MPDSRTIGIRARAERALAPGYSWCFCCGRPWKFVKEHSTQYTDQRGCFPLCEGCWTDLATPEARLPYYRMLWNNWLSESAHDPEDWERIKTAVEAGL